MLSPLASLLAVFGINKREILYAYAKSQIGKQKSGIKAPIEYGCAEAVNRIFRECFGGDEIGGDVSSARLYQALSSSFRFTRVNSPALRGDIIISPTGMGNGSIPNGHVGIVSDALKIMSNNSANGIWDEHLDSFAWTKHFAIDGGYPVYFFRVVV